jgi:hypothetical protein
MKSSSPWIVNDFNFGVSDLPRIRTHDIRGSKAEAREGQDVESNVSPLHDLSFADMRLFPQAVVQWIQEHHDLCEHYGLFPEYSPQLGLRNTVVPTGSPDFIKLIYSLCHQQLSNQLEPTEIEV